MSYDKLFKRAEEIAYKAQVEAQQRREENDRLRREAFGPIGIILRGALNSLGIPCEIIDYRGHIPYWTDGGNPRLTFTLKTNDDWSIYLSPTGKYVIQVATGMVRRDFFVTPGTPLNAEVVTAAQVICDMQATTETDQNRAAYESWVRYIQSLGRR